MKYNNEGTIHIEYILNKILMYSWFKKKEQKEKQITTTFQTPKISLPNSIILYQSLLQMFCISKNFSNLKMLKVVEEMVQWARAFATQTWVPENKSFEPI